MATNGEFAIYVRGLRKAYGSFEAVKGIDFEVRPGEVFGLLGPNGAGKTSTVEILEGLRPRTGGEVKVLEFDPDRQKQRLKDRFLLVSKLAAAVARSLRESGSGGRPNGRTQSVN